MPGELGPWGRVEPLSRRKAAPDVERSKRAATLMTDDDGATSVPGVYAGGDIVTGAATVILAMGAGKRAAKAMDSLALFHALSARKIQNSCPRCQSQTGRIKTSDERVWPSTSNRALIASVREPPACER